MKKRTWIGALLSLVSTLAFSAPPLLTQSASQVPVGGSISCNNGSATTANSYWRAFDLSTMGLSGPLVLNAVQFGIQSSVAGGFGATHPATVNVYTSAGAFPGSPLTMQATQAVAIPDQTLTVFDVPLSTPTPPLPTNSIVVIELAVPDGRPTGSVFFIGSNSAGQTGASFISAPDCGAVVPTDLAALGFPSVHIILNGNGTVTPRTLAENLACARDGINGLMQPVIVGPAQKNMLLGLLGLVNQYKDGPYRSLGLMALDSAIARVDGCALRTVPDTIMQGGTGIDFITTCPAQGQIHSCMKNARGQLTGP